MKILRRLSLAIFVMIGITLGTKAADTLEARRLIELADQLESQNKWDSILVLYEEAGKIYLEHQYYEQNANTIFARGNILISFGKPGEAIALYENITGGNYSTRSLAKALSKKGYANLYSGQIETAKKEIDQALNLQLKSLDKDDPDLSETRYNLGMHAYLTGSWDSAIYHLDEAIRIKSKAKGPTDLGLANQYNLKGAVYNSMRYYKLALNNFERAQEIRKLELSDQDPEIGQGYYNLGVIHNHDGDWEKALEYFEQATQILEKVYGPDHPQIGGCLDGIGTILMFRGRYDEAIDYVLRSREIMIKNYGPDDFEIAVSETNLGAIYYAQKKFKRALEHYEEAHRIEILNADEKQLGIATAKVDRGITRAQLGLFDAALPDLLDGLAIREKVYGQKNLLVGQCHTSLAKYYVKQKAWDDALTSAQKAIISYCNKFDDPDINSFPELKEINSNKGLLEALREKATALEGKGTTENLQLALQSYELIIQLADTIRFRYFEKNRYLFSQEIFPVFESAIRIAHRLFETSNDKQYLDLAFQFTEKRKAQVLLEGIRESNAILFGGIPDTLLARERHVKLWLAKTERSILTTRQNSPEDKALISHLKTQKFELKREQEEILKKLEKNYPKYYQLKYAPDKVNIEAIRNANPDKGSATISYFWGDSTVYGFYISATEEKLVALGSTAEIADKVFDLILTMRDGARIREYGNSKEEFNRFCTISGGVYNRLITPLLPSGTSAPALTIIPDNILGLIPFEVLLTGAPTQKEEVAYHTLPYLIRDHSIRYAYSGAFLLEDKRNVSHHAPAQKQFAGFAPDYSINVNNGLYASSRELFQPLEFNRQEIENTRNIMGGTTFLGPLATEKQFKSVAGEYRILHLAAHSKTVDSLPLLSGLALSAAKDDSSSGTLEAWEIYNLSLNAELAVLSACNTGTGKLEKGEGIMSIARAFRYAGCPNILMSLWQIDDASTTEIMGSFFTGLDDGLSKDKALQKAKLSFLDNGGNVHPYFWAGFVYLGDDRPITPNGMNWPWIIAGVLILLVIGGYVARKRKSS